MADWSATAQYYASEHWRRLSHFVRTRDHWTCRDCGFRAERSWDRRRMQAHHIASRPHVPYPTRMDVPSNCITLCWTCHMLRHGRTAQPRGAAPRTPQVHHARLQPRGPNRPRGPPRARRVT